MREWGKGRRSEDRESMKLIGWRKGRRCNIGKKEENVRMGEKEEVDSLMNRLILWIDWMKILMRIRLKCELGWIAEYRL